MIRAINTALLYISTFLSVNTLMFDQTTEDFSLPAPHATKKENQIIQQLFSMAGDNTVCLVTDHLQARYCFIFVSDQISLIGPYRTGAFDRDAISPGFFSDKKAWETYRAYYNQLPFISPNDLRLQVQILFISLYGDSYMINEHIIDMHEYLKGDIPILDEDFSTLHQNVDPTADQNEMFYYITQVRNGNYHAALSSYRRTMRSRRNTFALIQVIEGLSTVRASTSIALHLAGISNSVSDSLLTQFKTEGRIVTSIAQATQLCENMIESACALVRQHLSRDYSPDISAAVDYIHSHLSQTITIPELAKIAHLSPNRFSSRFHEEVGITPTAYILQSRMRNAAQLLVYTNMSVKHICTSVGILDDVYFTRCFKKEYGVPPTVFRKQGVLDEPSFTSPNHY